MARHCLVWLAAALLAPAPARAVSLIVDRLDTPDVVQSGDSVSFSFAFQFGPEEVLLATQAAISAPQLSEFTFKKARGPWDLSADFRLRGDDPMWVYAENAYGEDAPGVTWEEVGGLAPLGRFSAIAAYNGEIEFTLTDWVLSMFDGTGIPIDPAWQHIRTGVTVVGGADLPPLAPLPEPPPAAPQPPPIASPPSPIDYPQGGVYFEPATEDVPPTGWASCDAEGACFRRLIRGDYLIMLTNLAYPMSEAHAGGATPEPRAAALLGLGLALLAIGRTAYNRAP